MVMVLRFLSTGSLLRFGVFSNGSLSSVFFSCCLFFFGSHMTQEGWGHLLLIYEKRTHVYILMM